MALPKYKKGDVVYVEGDKNFPVKINHIEEKVRTTIDENGIPHVFKYYIYSQNGWSFFQELLLEKTYKKD